MIMKGNHKTQRIYMSRVII